MNDIHKSTQHPFLGQPTTASEAVKQTAAQLSGADHLSPAAALGLNQVNLAESLGSLMTAEKANDIFEKTFGVREAELERLKRSVDLGAGLTTSDAYKQFQSQVSEIGRLSAASLQLDQLRLSDIVGAKAVDATLSEYAQWIGAIDGTRVQLDQLRITNELSKFAFLTGDTSPSALSSFYGGLQEEANILSGIGQIHEQFKTPTAAALTHALAGIGKNSVFSMFEQEAFKRTEWLKSIADVQMPWARYADEAQSIRAFAELSGIGAAVRFRGGFEPELTAALRADLGDWRGTISVPAEALARPRARTEFYVERGFDRALTDFPEEVFCDGLSTTGEIVDYLNDASLSILLSSDTSPEEAAVLKRSEFGYRMLLRFERRIRTFINDLLTQRFGANWPKKRAPRDVYEAWMAKAESARQAGETFEPLIEAADFTDYKKIICRKDNFNEIFKAFFRNSDSVQESFNRLQPIRLTTMHCRVLTMEDVLFLVAECTRLLGAMGARST